LKEEEEKEDDDDDDDDDEFEVNHGPTAWSTKILCNCC
jgi:hypothetical protein